MDLKKELRIIVKYILPKDQHDKDVIENYVDTLVLIYEEYTKQLKLTSVSKSLTTEEQELEDMIKPLRGKCLGKKLRGEW